MCTGNISCVAFTHDARADVGDCLLRSAYDLEKCNRSEDGWDTYTLRVDSMAAFLQQQADAVVAHYRDQFPELAISAAWKDGTHDTAVAAGTVAGRAVQPE